MAGLAGLCVSASKSPVLPVQHDVSLGQLSVPGTRHVVIAGILATQGYQGMIYMADFLSFCFQSMTSFATQQSLKRHATDKRLHGAGTSRNRT